MPLKPLASTAVLVLDTRDVATVGIAWAPGAEKRSAAMAGTANVIRIREKCMIVESDVMEAQEGYEPMPFRWFMVAFEI
jgi:hypothetical protein